MNRRVWAGITVVAVLSGCSGDPAESATPTSTSPPTTTTTLTPTPSATTPLPTTSPDAPLVEEPPAPVAIPAPIPEAAVEETPDVNLYLETCEQFIAAIDGLAATGAVTREQAATGIADRLQSNPEWATIPAEDQPEILRGLTAAGNGAC